MEESYKIVICGDPKNFHMLKEPIIPPTSKMACSLTLPVSPGKDIPPWKPDFRNARRIRDLKRSPIERAKAKEEKRRRQLFKEFEKNNEQ